MKYKNIIQWEYKMKLLYFKNNVSDSSLNSIYLADFSIYCGKTVGAHFIIHSSACLGP